MRRLISFWSAVTGLWIAIFLVLMSTGPVACSLNNLLDGSQSGSDSSSVVDPSVVTSYTGALGMYHAAIVAARFAISKQALNSGLMTDELYAVNYSQLKPIDGRIASLGQDNGLVGLFYQEVQAARVQAAQASEALLKYGTSASYPLVGHAYALQAHMILLLGETFCSGIPLTEVPLGGTLRYTEALPAATLFERAIALFDTAYQYGKDSLPIATFAKVGKGRALLALGRYSEARAAVSDVATSSQYLLEFNWGEPYIPILFDTTRVKSPEGRNGIRWAAATPASQDPRLPFMTEGTEFAIPLRQTKYQNDVAGLRAVIADGVQARLIETEAQLQPAEDPSGPWLQTLNALRQYGGLPDTTDPGTKDGRIDLLFRERAFWLYLNGTRLGDMRRLVRQYRRLEGRVFPTGPYPEPESSIPSYGTEVVFVPPFSEQQYNPLYKGCISKGA